MATMFGTVFVFLSLIGILSTYGARIPAIQSKLLGKVEGPNYLKSGIPRPYKPIIFLDLDDTLYSRNTGLLEEFKRCIPAYCAQKLGIGKEEASQLSQTFYEKYGSSPHGIIVEHNMPLYDYEDFLAKNMDYTLLRPIPGLRNMLEKAQARLVLLTNSGQRHTLDTLKRIDLENVFELIIHAEFSQKDFVVKPNAKIYTQATQLVDPDGVGEYYFVDDNYANVRSARLVGWNALHLVEDASKIPKEDSQHVITHISEISITWPHLFATKPDSNERGKKTQLDQFME